jgi:hypothetical protein
VHFRLGLVSLEHQVKEIIQIQRGAQQNPKKGCTDHAPSLYIKESDRIDQGCSWTMIQIYALKAPAAPSPCSINGNLLCAVSQFQIKYNVFDIISLVVVFPRVVKLVVGLEVLKVKVLACITG